MSKLEWTAAQAELQQRHSLSSSKVGGAFGAIFQLPVHIVKIEEDNAPTIMLLMTLASSEASAEARELLLYADTSPIAEWTEYSLVETEDETLLVKMPLTRIADLQAEEVAEMIEQAVAVAAGVPKAIPEAAPEARVAIVNQQPVFLSADEIGKIRETGQAMNEAYATQPTNYFMGLVFGLAGVLGGGLVWGGIGAFVNVQAWIVAIGAGWLIGYLVLTGAGKTAPGIQVMIFVLTITAVLLGEVLDLTFRIMQEGGPLAPVAAAQIYFQNLDQVGGNFVFAVIGGLFGAYGALKMAAKPDFAPEIEVPASTEASS